MPQAGAANPNANCHLLPAGYDPMEAEPRACPANHVWATGNQGRYQCCKKPPL